MIRIVLISVLFFHVTTFSYAQAEGQYSLQIIPADKNGAGLKNLSYKKTFPDTLALKKELNNVLKSLYSNGFLAASFDSIKTGAKIVTAFLSRGDQYKWADLSFINFDNLLLHKAGIKPGHYHNRALDPGAVQTLQEKIIMYYENNGYPFASVSINCVEFHGDSVTGILKPDKSDLVTIDSIRVRGKAKITPAYIQRYIGIRPGDIYRENMVKSIGDRIREIQFVKEVRDFEVEFSKNKADIYLYLDDKKANQFNGILGLLPNDKTTGKLLLTGEVDLALANSIGKGESLLLNWKKLEAASQDLDIKLNYPFLFRMPIGFDGEFSLLKKDTTYLTVKINAGLQFLMQGGNFIKAYAENKKTSLISTKGMESLTALPSNCDAEVTLYGIGYQNEHFNYKFNPGKGYSVKFNAGAGEKRIRKNAKLDPALYETIDLYSVQGEGKAELTWFQPVSEKTTLKLQNKSGYIYNENLFENELFRLGGLKTIRGFNENSFLVSAYTITTVEYRLLFEQNSCAYLFFDGAYYEKNIVNKFVADFPFGFGAGIDFETKAGIFTVSYGLGKQFDNPVDIKSAKIHFGYLNRF